MEIINKLDRKDDIYNLKKDLLSNSSKLNNYQRSVVLPNKYNDIRIPGTYSKRSTTFCKYYTFTLTVNASGHFMIDLVMNELLDSAATTSSQYYTVDAAYDPASANGTARAGVAIDTTPWWALTTGTVRQGRLVSGCMRATSLAPITSRSGFLYGAMYRSTVNGASAFGAIGSNAILGTTIGTISTSMPVTARVTNGEGIQVNYVPSDEDDLQFLSPNTVCSTRHSSGDDVFHQIIIGQGLGNAVQVKLELYLNFEVIPIPGTSLAGTERTPTEPFSINARDVGHLLVYHRADLVRIINAYDGSSGDSSVQEKMNLNTGQVTGSKNIGMQVLDSVTDLIPGISNLKKGIKLANAGYNLFNLKKDGKDFTTRPYVNNRFNKFNIKPKQPKKNK